MKEKTLIYSFNMKYLPDKKNLVDFLSRYLALHSSPDTADEDMATLIETAIIAALVDTLYSMCVAFKEEDIQKITTVDPVYQMLMAIVLANDWYAI